MEGISLNGLIAIRGCIFKRRLHYWSLGLCGKADEDLIRYLSLKGAGGIEATPCEALARFAGEPNWSVAPFAQSARPDSILSSCVSTSIKQLLFLNWIELIALEHGLDTTLASVCKFKDTICICLLIVDDTERIMEWNRVSSVADATIELRKESSELIAKVTRWEKNGKISVREEVLSIQRTPFRLESKEYQPKDMEKSNAEPSLTASFDIGLNLKKAERQAKEALQLPFTKMQNEQGLVDIHMGSGRKVRAGGRVIYTPDQEDDLDDSDPDDDLNL